MATEIKPTPKMKATLDRFLAWQDVKIIDIQWVQWTDDKRKCALVRFEGEAKNGSVSRVTGDKMACFVGHNPFGEEGTPTPYGHITARLSRNLYCVLAFNQHFDVRNPRK